MADSSISIEDSQHQPQLSHTSTQQQHQSQSKSLYGKELRCMMYGFGDDKNPYTESVDLLEELVLKYVADTTRQAISVKKSNKITVDDIMYLVRRDKRKCDRVKELLVMNEELKKSRKAFDLEALATHKQL